MVKYYKRGSFNLKETKNYLTEIDCGLLEFGIVQITTLHRDACILNYTLNAKEISEKTFIKINDIAQKLINEV